MFYVVSDFGVALDQREGSCYGAARTMNRWPHTQLKHHIPRAYLNNDVRNS